MLSFWVLFLKVLSTSADTWVLCHTGGQKGDFTTGFLHVDNEVVTFLILLPIMGSLGSTTQMQLPSLRLGWSHLDIALRAAANVHRGRWARGEGSQQVRVCLGQEPGAALLWAGRVPAVMPLGLGAALGNRPCGFSRIRTVPQWISKLSLRFKSGTLPKLVFSHNFQWNQNNEVVKKVKWKIGSLWYTSSTL